MNFDELIRTRQSCRKFQDIPVEREKLDACARAALMGPSACNSQPWRFVVVDDRETARQLAKCLQIPEVNSNPFLDACPAFIVLVECPATLKPHIEKLVGSQHFAQIDIGIAAQNICLAATDQGLGSCMIGWCDEPRVKELLHIPENCTVRLAVAIGHSGESIVRQKQRKGFDQAVGYNQW